MNPQPESQQVPQESNVREAIGIAIGQASMCWSEVPKGKYDTAKAAKILSDLMDRLNEIGGDS